MQYLLVVKSRAILIFNFCAVLLISESVGDKVQFFEYKGMSNILHNHIKPDQHENLTNYSLWLIYYLSIVICIFIRTLWVENRAGCHFRRVDPDQLGSLQDLNSTLRAIVLRLGWKRTL
jgi:glucan phosphoethanolaminetransferase (alkaline phosphatase superfamily)